VFILLQDGTADDDLMEGEELDSDGEAQGDSPFNEMCGKLSDKDRKMMLLPHLIVEFVI
jgi:hypothetical protein